MTVLELARPLAVPAPPARAEALPELQPRGDDLPAGSHREGPPEMRDETAADAARRMVALNVPTDVLTSEELDVDIEYRGQGGHHRLKGKGQMFAGRVRGAPFAAVLAVADPLVLLTVSTAGRGATRWALVSGGPTVTARADALRLLRAMRADGDLVLRAGDNPELPPVELAGSETWTKQDEQEWQLFEDLATLEEWTGQIIPVPRELSASEVGRVAQAAVWVRSERVEASLEGPFRFTAASDADLWSVDELRLEQEFGVRIREQELSLGIGLAGIPVKILAVEVSAHRSETSVTARARDDGIEFTIKAPKTRRLPARRTQTPALRPGSASAILPGFALPVVARATSSLETALSQVAARPAASAPSSEQLLEDLRSERS